MGVCKVLVCNAVTLNGILPSLSCFERLAQLLEPLVATFELPCSFGISGPFCCYRT